ncbi:uncharacterized protein [Thunnus thynnus]|uniref:uncharacterized protein n=1 Tax=Thunnus thynnus TaxID=8237 RepID=UPI003527379C
MKTLCVAIVVLSLTSVCQPASLACEKLLKQENKSPDLSGRWHFIALSANNCWLPLLVNALLWPSVAMDITAKDTPNFYDANIKMKIYGYSDNKSTPLFYENNTLFAVDSNNRLTGESLLLLQTGCPDCLVMKMDNDNENDVKAFTLFSRRENVTADELKEFETQAECLGWTKPQMLKSDHGYETSKSLVNIDDDIPAMLIAIKKRLRNIQDDLLKCDPEILSNPLITYLMN